MPSSSSHALIGGLCGAALASTHGNWSVLKWSVLTVKKTHDGLWPKVVVPMFTSPLFGFVLGALLMLILTALLHSLRPYLIQRFFGKAQLVSAAWMALSHGTNDAQKTMGIIALTLFTGTKSGAFDHLPPILHFRQTPHFEVKPWVIGLCALTMGAGTAAGGWRIIRTLGHKVVRLHPGQGVAAETAASSVSQLASAWGIPVSTTHVISTSIMGVGATKRLSAVKWGLVQRIIWAWVATLPITGMLGWLSMRGIQLCGAAQ